MGKVVVVDDSDKIIGFVDKEEAVRKALIRRVSAVFLYDGKGNVLLQRRSKNKKSYPLCWVSSVSGHVEKGESYTEAAKRELKEELGISGIKFKKIDYVFTSKEEDLNKLPKFTTVFVGKYTDEEFKLDNAEVEEIKWLEVDKICNAVSKDPLRFTPTFINVINRIGEKLKQLV